MAPVQGDPEGVHALGCSMGDHAGAASSQASDFGRASAVLPVASFTGLAGDHMRSYLSQMQRAATTLAEAYRAVARFLPQVAEAIRAAQREERSLHQAQQVLTVAQQRFTHAVLAVGTAQAAVDAADALGALSSGLGLSAPGSTGPTPAQLAALAQAKHQLAQAQRQLQDATHRCQAARHRFEQAQQHRRSVLAAFVALCRAEAEVAGMAIPQPPNPFLSPFGPLLLNPFAFAGGPPELQAEVGGLEDLPVLLATGFLVHHPALVLGAVQQMNVASLNLWTASSVQQYLLTHRPELEPAHHNLFSLYTVEHVGSTVVKAAGSGLSWFGQHALRDLGYAWNATKGGATGTWFALTHPAADARTLEWAISNPDQFASKALDLKGLSQNPEKWASQLIPVLGTVAVTKGIGSFEAGTAEAAGNAASRASGLIDAAAAQTHIPSKLEFYAAADRQISAHLRVDDRAVAVRRAGSGFAYYDGLSTRAGILTSCQSDGGWGRDTVVGKVAERATP
jgi:uncharacterized protein YukE